MSKISIKLEDNTIIKRVIRFVPLGNFVMNLITINKTEYLLGDGDEYLRGYPSIVNFKDLRRL